MIEVKLKRKEIDPKTKETQRDGVIDTMRVVLVGKDKKGVLAVEWTLTLKYEGKTLPVEYQDALGDHWNDEVLVTLDAGNQQTELE